MARPEFALDVTVVFGSLIGVLDDQADRGARRLAFENTRQDFYLIRFITLCCVAVSPGPAPIEVTLDISLRQFHPGRTAIHDAAKRPTVTFAKRCYREYSSKAIARHR